MAFSTQIFHQTAVRLMPSLMPAVNFHSNDFQLKIICQLSFLFFNYIGKTIFSHLIAGFLGKQQ